MLTKFTGNRIRLASLCLFMGAMLGPWPIAVAADSCVKPKCPSGEGLVNGDTATVDQITKVRQTFTTYMADAKNYQSCLVASGLAERFLSAKHDEIQNEMEHAAAVFNRELRRFKQRRDVAVGAETPAAVDLR